MSTFWPHNRKAFLKQDIKNVTIKKVWQFYYTKMLKFGSTRDTTRVRKKKSNIEIFTLQIKMIKDWYPK